MRNSPDCLSWSKVRTGRHNIGCRRSGDIFEEISILTSKKPLFLTKRIQAVLQSQGPWRCLCKHNWSIENLMSLFTSLLYLLCGSLLSRLSAALLNFIVALIYVVHEEQHRANYFCVAKGNVIADGIYNTCHSTGYALSHHLVRYGVSCCRASTIWETWTMMFDHAFGCALPLV